MDIANSNTNSTIKPRISPALRFLIAAAAMLVMCGIAFGATPSAASLNGSYAFHLATPKLAYWSNSKSCKVNGVTNTYWASNSATYTELIYGVATFDGKGHVTLAFTQDGQINQNASNATIVITCTSYGPTNTGGNIVYEPAQTGTATGTYAVQSTGSGSMTISIVGQSDSSATMDFELAGFETNGVASTALLHFWDGDNDKRIGTGMAVHK
jgi:hypothetical protein